MVTGRQEPRLVLVSLTCEDGHVCLNGPDMEELRFPFKQPDKLVIDCRFYTHKSSLNEPVIFFIYIYLT